MTEERKSHDSAGSSAALSDLLAAFEAYIADGQRWSSGAFKVYVYRFAEFGVEGETANDLIRSAKEKLDA